MTIARPKARGANCNSGMKFTRPRSEQLSFGSGRQGLFQCFKPIRGENKISAAKLDKPCPAQTSLYCRGQGAMFAAAEFVFPDQRKPLDVFG